MACGQCAEIYSAQKRKQRCSARMGVGRPALAPLSFRTSSTGLAGKAEHGSCTKFRVHGFEGWKGSKCSFTLGVS